MSLSRLELPLQVMGAPVAGSNVRASVVTGGGLRMKGLHPKLRSRRVQMIFPLTGAERRGLVSLEAKKLKVMEIKCFLNSKRLLYRAGHQDCLLTCSRAADA